MRKSIERLRPSIRSSTKRSWKAGRADCDASFAPCDAKHLDRYLAEFYFRQNIREKLHVTDTERMALAVRAGRGKHLTYQTTHSEAEA